MRNGCGGQGGFKFSTLKDRLKRLPLVDADKLESLYHDIEMNCCDPHDDDFTNGGGFKDFILANYRFTERLLTLLHWTTAFGRLSVFLFVFIPLNLIGWKYFNWTKVW